MDTTITKQIKKGAIITNNGTGTGTGTGTTARTTTTMTSLFDRAVHDDPALSNGGYDQWFLTNYVWPNIIGGYDEGEGDDDDDGNNHDHNNNNNKNNNNITAVMSHSFHVNACRGSNTQYRRKKYGGDDNNNGGGGGGGGGGGAAIASVADVVDCRPFPLGPANIGAPNEPKSYFVGQTFRSKEDTDPATSRAGYTCTLECDPGR